MDNQNSFDDLLDECVTKLIFYECFESSISLTIKLKKRHNIKQKSNKIFANIFALFSIVYIVYSNLKSRDLALFSKLLFQQKGIFKDKEIDLIIKDLNHCTNILIEEYSNIVKDNLNQSTDELTLLVRKLMEVLIGTRYNVNIESTIAIYLVASLKCTPNTILEIKNNVSNAAYPENEYRINHLWKYLTPKTLKKFCHSCGSNVDENTNLCMECGKRYFNFGKIM